MNTAQTDIFLPGPSVPHQNFGRPQPGTISTGTAVIFDSPYVNHMYEVEAHSSDLSVEVGSADASAPGYPPEGLAYVEGWDERTLVVGSTGESYASLPSHLNHYGYYVVVDRPATLFEGEWSVNEVIPQGWTQPEFLVYGIVLSQPAAQVDLLQTQREERKATAELGKRVQDLLPDFSENDLARLVGVSRITWRGWNAGTTSARRTSRQRLLRLERILELRRRTDPGTPISHWLDSPVGSDLQVTPARLLADGRDLIVAFLAVHIPVPAADDPRLEDVPPILNDLLNLARVDERLAWRRQLVAYEQDHDA